MWSDGQLLHEIEPYAMWSSSKNVYPDLAFLGVIPHCIITVMLCHVAKCVAESISHQTQWL